MRLVATRCAIRGILMYSSNFRTVRKVWICSFDLRLRLQLLRNSYLYIHAAVPKVLVRPFLQSLVRGNVSLMPYRDHHGT